MRAAALLLCAVVPAAAESPADRIDALFAPCRAAGAPGASVIVIRDGAVAYKQAYGLADVVSGAPATTRTNYRLASVTKQFTAMAVMMLADRGQLDFDQTLDAFFPDLPQWRSQVTVRHLLTHTSGVRAYEPAVQHILPAEVTPANQLRDKDVLAILKNHDTTYFNPGAQYRYSNSGYALLALIVEKVSGVRFGEFLQRNIFAPAGMTRTVAHEEGVTTVPDRAYGHVKEGDRFVRRDQSATSAVLGDGGIYSSVEDLANWDRALSQGKLVKPETWRQAVTPAALAGGTRTEYGFGWEIGEFAGRRAWRHSGGTIGFANHILRLPDHRVTVAVLMNRVDQNPRRIAEEIAAMAIAGAAR